MRDEEFACLVSYFDDLGGGVKKSNLVCILLVAVGVFAFSILSPGQARPSADARATQFQVGAGFSIVDTDYATHVMYGITGFFDATYHGRFGLVIEGHTVQFNEFGNLREDSILGGGRYVIARHNRFRPYAKFVAGIGSIDFPISSNPNYHHDTYFVYEPGAGVDYNLTGHIGLNGDFGYQRWPDWPKNGLSPMLGTVGAYWRF
jgi:hypothetical protein